MRKQTWLLGVGALAMLVACNGPLRRAREAAKNKDWDTALPLYKESLKKPKNQTAQIYTEIAKIYCERKQFIDCIETAETGLKLDAKSSELMGLLAQANYAQAKGALAHLAEKGKAEKAMELLEAALKANPGMLEAVKDYARLCNARGDNEKDNATRMPFYKKTIALLEQTLKQTGIEPKMAADLNRLLGVAYKQTGNADAAIAALTQSTKLNGNESKSQYELAIAYSLKEKWAEALPFMQAANRLKPKWKDPIAGLALIYKGLGNSDLETQYREQYKNTFGSEIP